MAEYQATIDIKASPDQVFRFLSSVANMPAYLPHIEQVRLEEGDHVFATAEIGGRRRELDGFFRVAPEIRRIDWGSDGTPPYRGWLEVREVGADTARLEAHLHIEAPRPEELVGRSLDDALLTIRHLVEDEGAGTILGEERCVA